MKNTKKHRLLPWLWITFLAATLLTGGLGTYYVWASKICLPVRVSLIGVTPDQCSNVKVVGEKAIVGEFELQCQGCVWSGDVAFYKTLRIEWANMKTADSVQVELTYGDQISRQNFPIDPLEKGSGSSGRFYPNLSNGHDLDFFSRLGLILQKSSSGIIFLTGSILLFLLIIFTWRNLFLRSGLQLYTSLVKVADRITSKQSRVVLLLVSFGVLTFVVLALIVNFSEKAGTPNFPDSYDYQAIAVNYAIDGNFPVSGIVHPIETYKFEQTDRETLSKLERTGGFLGLHRAPVFSLLCGILYKIFGIHPVLIKYILLFILVTIGCLVAYLGFWIFQRKGLLAGIVAGWTWILLNRQEADKLVPGIIFIALWVVLAFAATWSYFKRPTLIKAIILGLIYAGSWLVNYSMMLVPLFVLLGMLFGGSRSRIKVLHLSSYVAIMFFVLLPWQIFVNQKADQYNPRLRMIQTLALDQRLAPQQKKVIAERILPTVGPKFIPDTNFSPEEMALIKQRILPETRSHGYFSDPNLNPAIDRMAFLEDLIHSPDVIFLFLPKPNHEMLSCHNEFVENGSIAKEWRVRDGFYARQKDKADPDLFRVVAFYWNHPAKFFQLSSDKLVAAFGPYPEMFLVIWLAIGLILHRLLKVKRYHRLCSWRSFLVLLMLVMAAWATYCFPQVAVALLVTLSIALLFRIGFSGNKTFDRWIGLFLLNYILTTIIAYGNIRFVQPFQPLMLLFALMLAVVFFRARPRRLSCDPL